MANVDEIRNDVEEIVENVTEEVTEVAEDIKEKKGLKKHLKNINWKRVGVDALIFTLGVATKTLFDCAFKGASKAPELESIADVVEEVIN